MTQSQTELPNSGYGATALATGGPGLHRIFSKRLPGRIVQARPFGSVVVMVVLAIIFQIMSGQFFSPSEFAGIFLIAASLGVMAAGVALLMISGEFDLSVGSMFAFVPIVMGELITKYSWNPWAAFLVSMLIPVGFGILHGIITTRAGIPSFITTLGSYFLLNGVAYIVTGGQPVLVDHPALLFSLVGGSLGISFLTAPMIWMLLVVIVLAAMLNFTPFGNWTFAAGSQIGIGRALGIPTSRVKTINFCICACLAGFAGCTSFASVGAIAPGAGADLNLIAMVAAVLGGTSLFGITGSIYGAMFGAIIIGELETGLVLVGAPGEMYQAMIGAILIVAVLINVRLRTFGVAIDRYANRKGAL